MQTSDEHDIYYYLSKWPKTFVSPLEICRRAGGRRRYLADPDWARPVLIEMAKKGLLEADPSGCYRLKPASRARKPRWLAPRFAALARANPDAFTEKVYVVDEDPEEQSDNGKVGGGPGQRLKKPAGADGD